MRAATHYAEVVLYNKEAAQAPPRASRASRARPGSLQRYVFIEAFRIAMLSLLECSLYQMSRALFGLGPSNAYMIRRPFRLFRSSSGRIKAPAPAPRVSSKPSGAPPPGTPDDDRERPAARSARDQGAPAAANEKQEGAPETEPQEVQRQRAYARFARAEKARQKAEQERRWNAYREKRAREREQQEANAAQSSRKTSSSSTEARTRKRRGARRAPAEGFNPERATTSEKDAHYGRVLSLEGKVTVRDIKAHYRRLASQYHPDKVGHLGEKLRALAEGETRRLNEAYAYFRQRYDF